MASAEKPFVYQEQILHPDLQQMLDDNFYMVWPNELEKYRHKITGLFGSKEPSPVNGDLLDKLPSLKVIGNCGVGYDKVDLNTCKSRGIRVGNTPDTLNDTTADMAFALLLATARRVCEGNQICRDSSTSQFDFNWFGFQVSGKTLGIVGMGRIGSEIAKRAKGFSMPVIYHNRHQYDCDIEKLLGATYAHSLHKLLEQSDFVVVVVPGCKENANLFGKAEFAAMKTSGIFINVSRGVVVDQEALVDALSNNKITAAGLDVTNPEPLPTDHPLLKLSNVTISPHSGK